MKTTAAAIVALFNIASLLLPLLPPQKESDDPPVSAFIPPSAGSDNRTDPIKTTLDATISNDNTVVI